MQLKMHIQGIYTAPKSSKSIKIECYIVANIKKYTLQYIKMYKDNPNLNYCKWHKRFSFQHGNREVFLFDDSFHVCLFLCFLCSYVAIW
jgi:hypothetical protein